MKIAYVAFDEGACTYYRADLPLAKLDQYTTHKVKRLQRFDKDIDDYIAAADVIMMTRPQGEESLELMDILKHNGKKIVIDYDDDTFCISPFSPHYESYGVENVQLKAKDGEVIDLWKDGEKGFNIEHNKRLLETIKQCIAKADLVTTTTPLLARRLAQWNDNVVPIPNSIDLNVWQKLPLMRKNKEEIRMGWAGGASHYEDWLVVEEAMAIAMKKFPNLKLVVMGHLFQGAFKEVDQKRIEFHSWVHTQAYPLKCATLDLDFMVIPLKDMPFNQAKSNIKYVEFGALQVPSVVSNVSPYKEWAREDSGIFVSNNTASWVSGISLMVNDPLLRAKLGQGVYNQVVELFDIEDNWRMWLKAYEKVTRR